MTDTLFLTMIGKYFDQCKSGEKTVEYRLDTPYWRSRIWNPDLKRIEMCRGRGIKKGDPNNLVFPWRGFRMETITHEAFGPEPVRVFAIPLTEEGEKR